MARLGRYWLEVILLRVAYIMRLTTHEYDMTADALQIEAQAGADRAEQERLISTAKLAKRMAELARERRRGRANVPDPQNTGSQSLG